MEQETALKTGLAGLATVIAYYSSNITPLVWLLIFFEVSDYITGMAAAYKNHGWSSQEAWWGFLKKIGYFFLVGVGFGVDYIINEVICIIGLGLPEPALFGILSLCYLLATEAISILENLAEFGIGIPFLSKFLKSFREKISEKGSEFED